MDSSHIKNSVVNWIISAVVIGAVVLFLLHGFGIIDWTEPPYPSVKSALLVLWAVVLCRDALATILDAYKEGALFAPQAHIGSALFLATAGTLLVFALRFTVHAELPTEMPAQTWAVIIGLWAILLFFNYEAKVAKLEERVAELEADSEQTQLPTGDSGEN